MKRVVLIAGPTASGKSALALALAARIGGVVVNADSMQVYRDLRVLTARPDAQDEARVQHYLFGHVDAAVNYSVGAYLADAARLLAELPPDRPVIVAGGTGLYFKALMSGLAAIPPVDPAIREALRNRLAHEGVEALHAELARRDPEGAARIMVRDRSRILRALEVLDATGRTMSEWHREGLPPLVDPESAVKIFLNPARDELKARIEKRFEAMLSGGALDEVRALAARHLPDTLPAMKAHGVPWLRRHLAGEISLEAAVDGSIMDTRRYAKRQVTWFRNQMPGWAWLTPDAAMASLETLLQT
ncbi:tRNA (adenosine(37)-N6)-dimethylallyltransferase MiaA [Pseudorhodoplanes sp.]|uniref:tRNA (adenosine(37)-N6)-dimethylallyltransferase MiaA n=1 Tax=Pseudorhodoplanes sp. TaxID=1934341 RepID=UPI00391A9ABF